MRTLAVLAAIVFLGGATAGAQTPEPVTTELVDVFDLVRQLRHKPAPPPDSWDYRKPMKAFAPVIGAKPSSGAILGVAGNIAFYRGEPTTTHISSAVTSVTFSTKKQTAITNRVAVFTRDDGWRIDADHRIQWTSLETNPLGTSADTRNGVVTKYDFFRLHHTAYYRVGASLFAGGGLYFDNHFNIGPREGEESQWDVSPYVQYTESHGLPIDGQISAGPSVDVMWDSRDSFINAEGGWLVKAGYRMLIDGFLGGDSSWQRANVDVRTYAPLGSKRHILAVWLMSEMVVGGTAPYFDLPATGLDTYGRSARGYSEGQFRGEKLAYAEIEYRGTLMKNGLVGMVAFLNTTTVTNVQTNEQLFDSFATGGGAGLRLLINKRSKTNLCFDIGVGKQGSKGVYLAIQEAF